MYLHRVERPLMYIQTSDALASRMSHLLLRSFWNELVEGNPPCHRLSTPTTVHTFPPLALLTMMRLHKSSILQQLLLLVLTILACTTFPFIPTVEAFFGTKTTTSSASVGKSPFTQQALDTFNKAFPFDREPPKSNPFNDFGMPYTDLDGTILQPSKNGNYRNKNKNGKKVNRRLTDISRERAAQSFNVLVQLYGEKRALSMVQTQPICLCFDSSQFKPALEAWTQIFGLEESQNMVARSPGLLAVKAEEASKSSDSTMIFSYIVGYTRPVGPPLLATMFFLLLTPALEGLTGIQFGINH